MTQIIKNIFLPFLILPILGIVGSPIFQYMHLATSHQSSYSDAGRNNSLKTPVQHRGEANLIAFFKHKYHADCSKNNSDSSSDHDPEKCPICKILLIIKNVLIFQNIVFNPLIKNTEIVEILHFDYVVLKRNIRFNNRAPPCLA